MNQPVNQDPNAETSMKKLLELQASSLNEERLFQLYYAIGEKNNFVDLENAMKKAKRALTYFNENQ